jgi:hypothetical protein
MEEGMIFKSQLRRQAILHFFLLWIPGIMMAGVGSAYFQTGLLEFLMVMAGLLTLGMMYWLLQSLVHWLAFILFERRVSRRYIYDYLMMNQYPAPHDDSPSAEEYFLSVVKNRELDPELRIKAAAEVGAFAAYAGAFERQRLRKIAWAANGAIKDYRLWLMHEKKIEEIPGPIAQQ